jgi:hypothetical protein
MNSVLAACSVGAGFHLAVPVMSSCGQDAPHGRPTDSQPSGDFGVAEQLGLEAMHLIGFQ